MEKFELLSKDIRRILESIGFNKETPVQTDAIPAILSGENVLIISPTGSGKTEAALLPIFERIKSEDKTVGTKVIYITPLRALNRDLLQRVEHWAKHLALSVEIRHGDTPQSVRRKQSLNPPDILITTPETMQVLLIGSRLRSNLKNLKYVVIDEIHQLASDRRGSQLSFGLERLEKVVGRDIQRIALSATVANPEEIGKFLCGVNRTFRLVDASRTPKEAEYFVEMPKPTKEDEVQARELFVSPQTLARLRRIADLIEGHERTLIFVNSRTVAEELGSRLSSLGAKVGVHHGSLPREEREKSEQEFKCGKITALVCTATLELGIDIGAVDLVIQYMSPRQVNSLIQRVGRSGHSLFRRSEGIILSVSPEDAMESIGISEEAMLGHPEPILVHRSPLDVLAHQIAGLLMEYREIELSNIIKIASNSHSFRSLTTNDLTSVARFMESMGYLSLSGDKLIRRRKCREYYLQNLSMIRDERRYDVIDATTQKKVGMLGEEFMLIHAEIGLHFIVKGKAWRIESIQEGVVYVTPVQDLGAAIPGWDGELMPIPESVARKTGGERRRIENLLSEVRETTNTLKISSRAEMSVRNEIMQEVINQSKISQVPTDSRIVIERFKNYLVVHTSAGDRVNSTLGELFEERLLRLGGLVRNWWSDGYRILLELSTEEFKLDEIIKSMFSYNSTLPSFIEAVMRKHFPFGYDMKFVAERFGALRRGRMLSGEALKELGVKFRFTPIYEETMREALATRIDIPRSVEILKLCEQGEIELVAIETGNPSPQAMYILSRYVELEDYAADGEDSIASMKKHLEKEVVSLFCVECAELEEFLAVGSLPDEPKCRSCNSRLLAVMSYGARFAANVLSKKKEGQPLSREEKEILAKARRSADIVLSYGKKGVIAQSVYGIGPQMASRVLSKMQESETEFYEDLLAAKLKFIETRRYWN